MNYCMESAGVLQVYRKRRKEQEEEEEEKRGGKPEGNSRRKVYIFECLI